MRRVLVSALLLLCLLALSVAVSALSPPPVFEHKADRNYKGTNCEVCQAVVKQTLRKLPQGEPDLSTQKTRRAREQRVSELTEKVCNVENFNRYEYSPPTMVSACNDFLSNHGEELEGLLYKGKASDREMRQKLCIDTGLCKQLWTEEAEEQKRDRSPEEAEAEAKESQRKGAEAEKKQKAEEKAEKARKRAEKKAAAEAALLEEAAKTDL